MGAVASDASAGRINPVRSHMPTRKYLKPSVLTVVPGCHKSMWRMKNGVDTGQEYTNSLFLRREVFVR